MLACSTELAKDEELQMPATEEAAAEVFDDIDKAYFGLDNFDATAYELEKMLGEEFELDELERERFKLKKQMRVVSKKVFELIARNSAKFCDQVQQHEHVRKDAAEMVEVISGIRNVLQTESCNVRNSLAILSNDRKRKGLARLRDNVLSLKTLMESSTRIKELMTRGEFPLAIKLCVEAKRAADCFIYLSSIRDMSKNLAMTLGTMESHIDDALASMTMSFNPDRYNLIYSAYLMLNKTAGAAQKLQSFFHATIQASARTVLVELLSRTTDIVDLDQLSYDELCESIPFDFILECLQELGLVLCKILCIYHNILRFHIDEDQRRFTALDINVVDLEAPPVVEKDVCQTIMIEGLFNMFEIAAEKYNLLLAHQNLSDLKIDDFIRVLEMTNKFRRFGRLHFQNPYASLSSTLDKIMSDYFAKYHSMRMEELNMFLEHEVFALCPVPLQFTFFDLPEFHFLKESSDAFDEDSDSTLKRYNREASELSESLNLIQNDSENPFLPNIPEENSTSIRIESNHKKGSMDRSSSEESCYDDAVVGMEKSLPIVCNSALNLLKYFGRYIQMTSMLHSIADQVIHSIIQLYEYMFYTIYNFFAKDADLSLLDATFTTPRLQNTMNNIQNRIIFVPEKEKEGSPVKFVNNNKYSECKPSPIIDKTARDSLYAITERIVGVESVIFLAKQLELLRPVLDSLLPPNKKSPLLAHFYKTTLSATFDLRDCVYGCVVSKHLEYETLMKKIKQVKWDISDIKDQHSEYVDFLCTDFNKFYQTLEKCCKEIHASADIKVTIWTHLAKSLFRTLVQAYSEASKKCSNEGRALMLLDTEQLNIHLETLSDLKPVPFKSHVEDYVKAFYLPETCLPDWISSHSGEYTTSQINAVFSHASKAGKSRIMNIIEGKILENND